MHILKALDPLEKLEDRIARLYEWFSENLKDDAEASAFFYRMSIDESAHANLVRYQRRVASQNMKLFGDLDLDLDLSGIQKEIARIEAILAGPPPMVEEAVKISLDIENNAAKTHYGNTVEKAASSIATLLTSLSAFDCKHCEVFEEFAAKRGYPFEPACVPRSIPSSAVPTEAPAANEQHEELSPELMAKMEDRHLRHDKIDLYDILGVSDYASSERIKQAFSALAQEFHPDKHMNVKKDIKQKLSAIFSSMTNAYAVLMDPVRRTEYDHIRLRK